MWPTACTQGAMETRLGRSRTVGSCVWQQKSPVKLRLQIFGPLSRSPESENSEVELWHTHIFGILHVILRHSQGGELLFWDSAVQNWGSKWGMNSAAMWSVKPCSYGGPGSLGRWYTLRLLWEEKVFLTKKVAVVGLVISGREMCLHFGADRQLLQNPFEIVSL